ncbi:MAG TPA: hypothetical protein VGI71_23925 [Scandinavium sp.]
MVDDVEHMLTTVDNPWNPFTNYDEWYSWDRAAGYDTPGLLARISKVSLDLPDTEIDSSIEQAIDEICQMNINGMYKKASKPAEAA